MIKALDLMKSAPSVTERAQDFVKTIQRNLQKEILDTLIDEKEKIEDKITSQKDFTLHADLNAGRQPISREECERRFKTILTLEYDLDLLNEEIAVKQEIFNKYFGDVQAV